MGPLGAAAGGAEMLQEVLRRKFAEALAQQKLQEDMRQADMQHQIQQSQLNQGQQRISQDASQFEALNPLRQAQTTHIGAETESLNRQPVEAQKGRDFTHTENEANRTLTGEQGNLNRGNALTLENLRGRHSLAVANARGSQQGSSLTPEGLAFAANLLKSGGGMLPLGMGASGTRQQIINEAARGSDPNALAGSQAGYQANKASLVQLQKNRDSIKSFEQTAQKNIGVLKDTMKQLTDMRSPLLNQPIRSLEANVAGDPTVAKFNAARRVVVNEIAKITANPGLSGVLTDESRKEANELIRGDHTIPQMLATLDVLVQDMGNRIGSFDTQIQEVQGRFGGGHQPAQSDAGRVYYDANGNPIKK